MALPECISDDGVTVMLTDEHGRGLYLNISELEVPTIEDVTDAAVDPDVVPDDKPAQLDAIENPPPKWCSDGIVPLAVENPPSSRPIRPSGNPGMENAMPTQIFPDRCLPGQKTPPLVGEDWPDLPPVWTFYSSDLAVISYILATDNWLLDSTDMLLVGTIVPTTSWTFEEDQT